MSDPIPDLSQLVVDLGGTTLDPVQSGVYLLWDADNTPLYVGESCNVLRRIGDHLGTPEIVAQVARVSIVPCDEVERRALEAFLIAYYRPALNRRTAIPTARTLRVVKTSRRGPGPDREQERHADEAIRAILADHGQVTPRDLTVAMAGERSRGWSYDYLAKLAGRGLLDRPGDDLTYVAAGDWAA